MIKYFYRIDPNTGTRMSGRISLSKCNETRTLNHF